MGQRSPAPDLRALQSAIESAGDEQVVRIVDLVDTLQRQDADTILQAVRPRLRMLRLDRSLQLSRLLGMPLEAALVDGARWRPTAPGFPRSALDPLCEAVSVRSPALVAQVAEMIAGVKTGDAALVRAAGEVFWPGAAAALMEATDAPESWGRSKLPATSFPHLAAAAAMCLGNALTLDSLADPTVNNQDRELNLSAMLRRAQAAGPMAWSMLLVVMFCAMPDGQAPQDALLNQPATELRQPADLALQQVWAWIEAVGKSAPRNANDAATTLRSCGAVLKALATSRGQRPRAATLQAQLRAAYLQHVAEAAQARLISPLAGLAAPLPDAKMAALEDQARGLRRLMIEVRNLGSQPDDAANLQEAVRVASACSALPLIDRARLAECLGFPRMAATLLRG